MTCSCLGLPTVTGRPKNLLNEMMSVDYHITASGELALSAELSSSTCFHHKLTMGGSKSKRSAKRCPGRCPLLEILGPESLGTKINTMPPRSLEHVNELSCAERACEPRAIVGDKSQEACTYYLSHMHIEAAEVKANAPLWIVFKELSVPI